MASRLTKEQRLKRFLEGGFFPRELPPPFHTQDFAKYRAYLMSAWPSLDLEKFKSTSESYTIPRHLRSRRKLSIINPINQYKISKLISDNWNEIRKFLQNSQITEFQPIFDPIGDRTFFDIDFDKIEVRTAEILSICQSAVKTDISRYYPTIYTHSVAWALYTKSYCKNHMFTASFKSSLGNKIDTYIRQCQDNQSIGIPIGPETSRVIGEIIGNALEQQILNSIPDLEKRSLRYVDDIVVGYNSDEGPDSVISKIQRAFAHFELEMNIEKTKIYGLGERLEPEWIIPLKRNYQKGVFITIQELEEYFKTANFLAQENSKDSVTKYAMKRSRSFRFDKDSWKYYQYWIIRLARKNADCMPLLAQILIEKRFEGYIIDENIISKFINENIHSNAELYHTFEVSWLLFMSKGLSINIESDIEDKIISMNNSICALLLFDLNSRGLLKKAISPAKWASAYDPTGLKDERWLFVYEATIKGWMSHTPCFIAADPFFGPMKAKKISFYDQTANVPKTRKELTRAKQQKSRIKFIFAHMQEYF